MLSTSSSTNPFESPRIEDLLERIMPMMEHRVMALSIIDTYCRCLEDPIFFYQWLAANGMGNLPTDKIKIQLESMPSRIQALLWGLEATEWK